MENIQNSSVKIKKKWLFSFKVILSFWYGLFSFGLLMHLHANILILILELTIWAFTAYHCAYKKDGTAWLMFTMIIIPLQVGGHLMECILMDSIESAYLTLIFYVPLISWFWINCYRLRKSNKMKSLATPAVTLSV